MFLILISGLVVVGSWILSGFFSTDVKVRVISVSAIVYGYPFIPASNQIYPEFIAGIILLFTIIHLISNEIEQYNSQSCIRFLYYMAVSFLPWLHIKFSAPALIATCALAYSERKLKRNILYSIQPFIFLLLSSIILAIYNAYAFGNILGPYKEGALTLNSTSIMVLLGLHFDRFQGMFLQNIAFIIIPFYILPFHKKHTFVALVILGIYASIIVPNALHTNWYGGRSFAGRFQWSGVIVLIPFVIYGFSSMMRQYPRTGFTLASFAICLNIIIYTRYTFSDFQLYNKSGYQSFIPWIDKFLPSLYDSTWAYSYPVNLAWAIILLFTISTMVIYYLNSRIDYSKIVFLLIVGLFLLVVATNYQSHLIPLRYFYFANQLPSQIGQVSGTSREIKDNVEVSGFLSFGPYRYLPPGNYIATFEYTSDATSETSIGSIDVTTNAGKTVITRQTVYGTNGVPGSAEILFSLQDVRNIEVRFWYDGNGTGFISLRSLEIRSK